MIETDVCIVGAGPAGTIASLFLSKYKVPHILIDRAVLPREKVCGEFYDGRLRNVLNLLDPEFMKEMFATGVIQDIRQYSYTNSKSQTFGIQIPVNKLPRISTIRYDFDKYLLDRACESFYIQYFDDRSMVSSSLINGGIIVHDLTGLFAVKAKTLIVATGSNSPLAKSCSPKGDTSGHFLLASRAYYSGVENPDNQDAAKIYFFRKPYPYYLYLLHLPKGLVNAEIAILKKVATKHRVNPSLLLEKTLNENEEIRQIFSNAKLQSKIKVAVLPKTTLKRPISAERVLLVGSAGTSINPVTGWGVGHAAFEAMCAANQYVESRANYDFSAQSFKNYDKKVYQDIYKDLLIGRFADFCLNYGTGFLDFGIGFMSRNQRFSKSIGHWINRL